MLKAFNNRFFLFSLLAVFSLFAVSCGSDGGGGGSDGGNGDVINAAMPNITAHPQGANYSQGATAAPLSVAANSADGGTLSYRWYRNTSNSNGGGTLISGATGPTYTPPTTATGTIYYYAVVTNTNNSVNGNTTANAATGAAAIVVTASGITNATAPYITAHPQGASYTQGDMATALNVTASSTDGGSISYQWYRNTSNSNSGGTLISGAAGSTYTPPTTATGTIYYYAVVTNTNNSVNGNTTATLKTNTAAIVVTAPGVTDAAAPNITAHPQGASYNQGATAMALSVTASSTDGGTLSYQWYSNTSNSNTGGTLITGETNTTYTPPTTTAGTIYYYAVVTNTNSSVNGNTTANASSNTAAIIVTAPGVTDAAAPNITAHPQGASYNQGATAIALSVTASSTDGGTLSYQWYSNSSNASTGGTLILGETNTTYTPPTTTIGTTYYYAVVTNTNNSVNGNTTATLKTNTAAVIVNAFDVTEYTVSFYDNSDIINEYTETVENGTQINLPLPTKANYAFDGWLLNGIGTPLTTTYTVRGDTVFVAKWISNSGYTRFDVFFYDDGAIIPELSNYGINNNIPSSFSINLSTPVKAGYTFDGWLLNNAGDPLNGNVTITVININTFFVAKWTIDDPDITEHNIYFYENGVLIPQYGRTVSSGTHIILPTHTPPMRGYSFDGWQLNESGIIFTGDYTVIDNVSFQAELFLEDAIIIRTATDLYNIRSNPSGRYILADNISLSAYSADSGGFGWEPIGTAGSPFNGILDGDGFKITDLYVDSREVSGLFGYVTGGAVINNLTVEISALGVTGANYAGTVAGRIRGSENSKVVISDVHVTGTGIVQTDNSLGGHIYAGGIAGSADNVTISVCSNEVEVSSLSSYSSYSYSGGIFGYVGGAYTTITNCHNTNNISSSSSSSISSSSFSGGIVGKLSSTIAAITNSYNIGNVSFSSSDSSYSASSYSYFYSGGLVGSVSTDGLVTIKNSYNTGDISSSSSGNSYSSKYYSGGMVGDIEGAMIADCYNIGNISSSSNSSTSTSYSYSGGIVGFGGGTITNSYNTGYISSSSHSSYYSSYSYSGGIVGFGGGTITNSYNTGYVSSSNSSTDSYSGGIIGYIEYDTVIVNCYNTGYASSSHSGKIVGYIDYGTVTITNCYNTTGTSGGIVGSISDGTVTITNCYNTGTSSGGGIVGSISGSTVTITNCYNTGDVSSSSSSGGIVGTASNTTLTITNCYNTGDVSSSSSYYSSGGIVGTASNTTLTITNCYNTGNISSNSYSGGIVGYVNLSSSNTVTITNNAAINAEIKTGTYIGRIIGGVSGTNVNINNNFALDSMAVTISGSFNTTPVNHGISKAYTALVTQSTYSDTASNDETGGLGWDFTNIWRINEGFGHPVFNWQKVSVRIIERNNLMEYDVIDNTFQIPNPLDDLDFMVWNSHSDGSGTVFIPGDYIPIVAGITLYAVFKGDSPRYPIEIYTSEQLYNIRYKLSKHYKLMSNIDLASFLYGSSTGWEPIGGSFTGSLDGDNYSIKNLYIDNTTGTNIGLFGSIRGGSVKNLGVELATEGIKGKGNVGAIAGQIVTGFIENSHNIGNLSSTTTDSSYFGGIIGYASGLVTIVNCYNTGDVSSSSSYSGGIIGYVSSTGTATITNCYNTGDVSASSYSGGIIGYVSSTGTTITNCYNTGDVSASSYSGGIIGYVPSTGTTITNCYNTGDVSSSSYSGGIIGSGMATITNCSNTGDISSSSSSSSSDPYSGGIIGKVSGTVTITNCYNTGDVSSSSYSGGIIGAVPSPSSSSSSSGTITITNCYNTGDVSSSSDYSGGIIGSMFVYGVSTATITNCYNTGDVSSSRYSGGIVGHVYVYGTSTTTITSTATIVNCYNTGDVFSSSDSGGIIGCVNVHVSGTATITSNVAISAEINGRWRGRIVGYLSGSNITVSNNFALDSMTAIGGSFDTTPANHGISKTEPQLKTRSTYEDPVTGDGLGGLGWQFGNDADHPWKMPEGGGYPILYWQTEP